MSREYAEVIPDAFPSRPRVEHGQQGRAITRTFSKYARAAAHHFAQDAALGSADAQVAGELVRKLLALRCQPCVVPLHYEHPLCSLLWSGGLCGTLRHAACTPCARAVFCGVQRVQKAMPWHAPSQRTGPRHHHLITFQSSACEVDSPLMDRHGEEWVLDGL